MADCSEINTRDSSGTCSIGIARFSGGSNWDVTVYNVPQSLRQDLNVIATVRNAQMGMGGSINITTLAQPITITNIDNAPVFTYNEPVLQAPLSDPSNGITKVQLRFDIPKANLTWTTDDCGPGNVIFSAGRESWSCDFLCTT
jgi:hypothetical protein